MTLAYNDPTERGFRYERTLKILKYDGFFQVLIIFQINWIIRLRIRNM